MMWQQFDFNSFCTLLTALTAYLIHAFFGRVKITTDHVHMLSLLCLFHQVLPALSTCNETDLEHILCYEKLNSLGIMFSSVVTLGVQLTLPMHAMSAVLFTYKRWQIVGFETGTPLMVFTSIGWNFGLGTLAVFILCTIKASVAAKRETHASSSMMLGFQKVLRGVCDGDIVLQRSSGSIVEDAVSLERLLKSSPKLQHTNFLDLFLEQRCDSFQQFHAISQCRCTW
eukprot:Skav202882  [mRNA]  locus=scaffold1401:167148:167828:- [translate_table: standard]